MVHTPPEVADLEDIVFSDEQVLRFQVPVNKSFFVEEVNSADYLDEIIKSLVL